MHNEPNGRVYRRADPVTESDVGEAELPTPAAPAEYTHAQKLDEFGVGQLHNDQVRALCQVLRRHGDEVRVAGRRVALCRHCGQSGRNLTCFSAGV